MSGRAVEAAGDCSTLLLDKTGTITYGNRMAAEFLPAGGTAETDLAEAALLSSLLGMVFSFFAGLAALKWLSSWLESGRWYIFGIYCLVASAGVFYLHAHGL